VNADDFGMNAETNLAIVEAFASGAISSTTLMVNMPGFEQACELSRSHNLAGKIGVHLNLTEGPPLTESMKRLSRFCDDRGLFRPRRTIFLLSREEMVAVEKELAAQVQACIDKGIQPTHLDSHQHIHTEWPIGAAVIHVARRYGIGAVRLSRNCGPGIDWTHKLYKAAYNARLRLHGLAKTQYFGSITDVPAVLAMTRNDIEIMVHLGGGLDEHISDGIERSGLESRGIQGQLTSYA
jgi:predicted glycoside hydrolase/deacetylase ChbG (UPF0249 family)